MFLQILFVFLRTYFTCAVPRVAASTTSCPYACAQERPYCCHAVLYLCVLGCVKWCSYAWQVCVSRMRTHTYPRTLTVPVTSTAQRRVCSALPLALGVVLLLRVVQGVLFSAPLACVRSGACNCGRQYVTHKLVNCGIMSIAAMHVVLSCGYLRIALFHTVLSLSCT